MLSIENRRYIGSKRSLKEAIFNLVEECVGKKHYVFADLFAGTGLVSEYFLSKGKDVIVNDILFSNYVAYQAWLGKGKINKKKLESIVEEFNRLDAKRLKENYFSKIYGGKYFASFDARKIGYIRERIARLRLTQREQYILITSLMYTADKIANTVGHFEHYLSQKPKFKDFKMQLPTLKKSNSKVQIFMQDANRLVHNIVCDVAYIDPPYNARQYVNFYHVLENLARWDKPTEFEGTSMKFKRQHLKSDYSKSKAPQAMRDLVNNIKAKYIVVSYNNTYSAKSTASNNRISQKELEQILQERGKIVLKKEFNHRFFNSGKTNFKNHKERLYVCKID